MIWMTWRQFRVAAIAAGAAVIALAAALAATRPALMSLYTSAGLPACHAACATEANNFLRSVQFTHSEDIRFGCTGIMYLAPAVLGLFWGAPLIARELDSGTFRLAWSQSVTRLARRGVEIAVSYQPESRYWELQSSETGMYLALAAGLGALCYWAVRRRQHAA